MKFWQTFLLIVLILTGVSCSRYEKLQKEGAPQARLEAANKYFKEGNYFKALQLFDQLIVELRGMPQFEDAYYKYCWCNYQQEQYLTAAYYFKNLTKTLPNSKYAEEALYMSAYCQYIESAEAELDQTSTKDALNEFQLFVNKYPKSERVAQCNDLMDKLWFKLETKDFNSAMLYFKIEEYKAAVVCFNNLLKDYPATKYKEQALFYTLKSEYYYALGSVDAKKKERFQDAAKAYNVLIAQYPQTTFMKEAQAINSKIKQQISKLK
jgi:outer membrane protein assembly factor BamD